MILFQSAPANYGGRIRPVSATPRSYHVSIRARQLRRANTWGNKPLRPTCFNPRPPITAGESRWSLARAERDGCFNPRPPITAGESPNSTKRSRLAKCFNPRPPITAGETTRLTNAGYLSVSIRARQLRRANPRGRDGPVPHVSIRARQLRRANPRSTSGVANGMKLFQSAPANYGGRIHAKIPAYEHDGFNPRPPITAGESLW